MAPSSLTPLATNKPLSIKEIADKAKDFAWNPRIPMKVWLRTANSLNQEGRSYLEDGNLAQAYFLYMRYLTLLMDCFPTHPDAKTSEGKRTLVEVNKSLPDIATHLENIKPYIQREYEAWVASESKRKEIRRKQQADHVKPKASSLYEEHASKDPALSSSSRLLDAGDHQELAVELAQREIRRRNANRNATRIVGTDGKEEPHRRTAGFWDNWTNELAERQVEEDELFRRQLESTSRIVDGSDIDRDLESRQESRPSLVTSQGSGYNYPSISKPKPLSYEFPQSPPRHTLSPQPPRPPKEDLYRYEADHTSRNLPPELPAKELSRPKKTPLTPEISRELPTPPPKIHDEPPAPSVKQKLTFKPAAYLENGEPIRSIFLPNQLRHKFLSIASDNTRRGLEMCGILCGTAVNNALFVRCLLIPEQKCTSDTCETENEGSMLEYCMNEDLLMLGWIHTHPTQTCFMSSRDLHTQAGYQVMMPESIAIVCAPKFEPSYGIFRLTCPPGLDHILGCTQSATFHPHAVDNLYTGARRPKGHVYESDKLEFYVKDLRPGVRNSTVQHKGF